MSPQPLRQLTIRLACTHAADRAWILGRLSPHERGQMDALLMEVTTLGLHQDPAVLMAIAKEPFMPLDGLLPCSSREHHFWLSLSEQALPRALATALSARLAITEVAHA